MNEVKMIKVTVMSHPILGARLCDALFSIAGEEPETLDGIKKDYFIDMGLDTETTVQYEDSDPNVYRIMARALASKLSGLDYLPFKSQKKTMRKYYKIAEFLTNKESSLGVDLNLPEVVIAFANLPATMFLY